MHRRSNDDDFATKKPAAAAKKAGLGKAADASAGGKSVALVSDSEGEDPVASFIRQYKHEALPTSPEAEAAFAKLLEAAKAGTLCTLLDGGESSCDCRLCCFAGPPIGKQFPFHLDNHLYTVDVLYRQAHPRQFRLNSYFAKLCGVLPYTKTVLTRHLKRSLYQVLRSFPVASRPCD